MRLHILVEGPSEEAFLEGWLGRFLPPGHTFKIIRHRGKGRLPRESQARPDPKRQGLLDQLPAKLRAYGRTLNATTDRLLVLVDQDEENCEELKERLLEAWHFCQPRPEALFRIAIEELEAFYLGDSEAIRRAYPKMKVGPLRDYEQDSVCGTWELFMEVIGAASEDKVAWARKMGQELGIRWQGARANRSPSFQQFCTGLLQLAGEPGA